MKRTATIGKGAVALALSAACVIGVLSAATGNARPIGPSPCPQVECPDVWNPVICPNGRVYSNLCYATRACQTGCVAY